VFGFTFNTNTFYRDAMALFGFDAAFAVMVVVVVWFKVREKL
jgi:hypothetical protein